MRSGQITTSAALFFEPKHCLPIEWLGRGTSVFSEHHLTPILFTAGGGEFELDDCYVLGDPGNDLVLWGDAVRARKRELVDAITKGDIYYLSLDVPHSGAGCRSDWRGNVSADLRTGELYLGFDEELAGDLTSLLRRAYETARGLFDVRYGIAYKMRLADEPDCYATGYVRTPLDETLEMVRHRSESDLGQRSSDELWTDELNDKRRHLKGFFRAAYPASVISDLHLQRADLRSHPIGKLSELDRSLWLWELSEGDVHEAEAFLKDKKALVHQIHQDR